jgi:hypothetical protein
MLCSCWFLVHLIMVSVALWPDSEGTRNVGNAATQLMVGFTQRLRLQAAILKLALLAEREVAVAVAWRCIRLGVLPLFGSLLG